MQLWAVAKIHGIPKELLSLGKHGKNQGKVAHSCVWGSSMA